MKILISLVLLFSATHVFASIVVPCDTVGYYSAIHEHVSKKAKDAGCKNYVMNFGGSIHGTNDLLIFPFVANDCSEIKNSEYNNIVGFVEFRRIGLECFLSSDDMGAKAYLPK